MKPKNTPYNPFESLPVRKFSQLLVFLCLFCSVHAVNKQSAGVGNWSNSAMWTPAGVPAAGDNILIRGGDTVTVDGVYSCTNLDLGTGGNADAGLRITTAGNSLTITGDLKINPNNRSKVFTFDAGPGTINVNGTFSTWSTTGTNKILVGSGAISFAPAVTISSSNQQITFSGAGTVTFNGAFTDQQNKLTTYTGCTVNFGSSYTVNTGNANWNGKGTAVFTGTSCSITPTKDITFNNIQVNASKTLTLNSGAGNVSFDGNITLGSSATFTCNEDFEMKGSWTNNGGTYTGTGYTVTLNGTSQTIGGTGTTTFGHVTIGSSAGAATNVSYTVNQNISCVNMVFNGTTLSRTLTLSSGTALAISGNLTMNQPTASGQTNLLDVGAGTCTVSGNLDFVGTSLTTTKVCKINVSSGAFTLNGTLTWMVNTAVETEVISVATGTVTFANSLTMPSASGTLQVTGTGTVNFNGSSAPSFNFGGTTSPVFSAVSGSTLYFAKGFSNTITPLTLPSGSNITVGSVSSPANFTIDPASTITNNGTVVITGNLTSTAAATFINGANATLEIKGSISSNVTLTATAAGNTVKYSGTTAQTIKPTTYVNLTTDNAADLSTSGVTTVTGVLTLTRGIITTTAANILKLTSTASCNAGNYICYVSGPMSKTGNTAFTFPIGKNGRWMRAGASGMTSASTEVTAEYFNTPYSDITTIGGTLTQVSPSQYWMIDRIGSSDPVKIRLYWENATMAGIVNCDYLTIAHYTGGQWVEEPATPVAGSECVYGGGTGSVETDGTVSTFSPFGFGGSGGGALPIKLVSFTAAANGSGVKTSWVTELEINNAYFTVERSADAQNFTSVTFVPGAGNSTKMLSYDAVDTKPLTGTSYYRLKQTDYDGQFSYSDIVPVTIGQESEFVFSTIASDNDLLVNVSNTSDEVAVVIYDLTGREIFSQSYGVDKTISKNTLTIPSKSLFRPGMYVVSASSNGKEQHTKVMLR